MKILLPVICTLSVVLAGYIFCTPEPIEKTVEKVEKKAVKKIVDDRHFVALLEKRFAQQVSDVAGAAGNKHIHRHPRFGENSPPADAPNRQIPARFGRYLYHVPE